MEMNAPIDRGLKRIITYPPYPDTYSVEMNAPIDRGLKLFSLVGDRLPSR